MSKENSAELTLPIYKVINGPQDLTREEAMNLQGNDPVAETEFREMATLFLQMHELVCGAPPRDLKVLLQITDSNLSEEGLHILQARCQSLVDNTGSFNRPIRTR